MCKFRLIVNNEHYVRMRNVQQNFVIIGHKLQTYPGISLANLSRAGSQSSFSIGTVNCTLTNLCKIKKNEKRN